MPRRSVLDTHCYSQSSSQPNRKPLSQAAFVRIGAKVKRIVLPVRHLQYWIEHHVLLVLKQAPFDKRDAQLLPAAGSCVDCPKRTGHNKLLFADVREDACKLCGIRATASVFRWLAAAALPA
jgi:hypothetical protein